MYFGEFVVEIILSILGIVIPIGVSVYASVKNKLDKKSYWISMIFGLVYTLFFILIQYSMNVIIKVNDTYILYNQIYILLLSIRLIVSLIVYILGLKIVTQKRNISLKNAISFGLGYSIIGIFITNLFNIQTYYDVYSFIGIPEMENLLEYSLKDIFYMIIMISYRGLFILDSISSIMLSVMYSILIAKGLKSKSLKHFGIFLLVNILFIIIIFLEYLYQYNYISMIIFKIIGFIISIICLITTLKKVKLE